MTTCDHGSFYDVGWYARMSGMVYRPLASQDWRDGWNDADETIAAEQEQAA